MIGGGPAGLAGAIAAGILGRSVALVERSPELGGRFVLIATGSRPVRPPEFPFAHARVWNSDEILARSSSSSGSRAAWP